METFLDAFSEYRVKLGLPAVAIDLPVVEGIGLVVERGIVEQLRAAVGVTITEDQFYTLVEGAIIGSSSGLNTNGISRSWMPPSRKDLESLAWAQSKRLSVVRRLRTNDGGAKPSFDEGKKPQDLLKGGSPELLLKALSDKVSSITMIDRDEITLNRSLLDYGLDSLFSLELRNWIRRTMDVDLALKDITAARDLQALMDRILSLTKRTVSVSSLSHNKTVTNTVAESQLRSDTSNPPADGETSQLIPLSPFQRLLHSLDGFEGHALKAQSSFRYHFGNFKVHVTAARVEHALRKLFTHHPMLRARFKRLSSDGALVHEIASNSQASFLLRLHTPETPLQLGKTPNGPATPDTMLIADLGFVPEGSWIVLTSHYVTIDGVSLGIICKDLEGLLMDTSPDVSSSGSFARWVHSQGTNLTKAVGSKLPRTDNGFWNLQKNRASDRTVIERQLLIDSDVTERLVGACNAPLNTKPVELLITAVLLSFRKTFSDRGSPALYSQLDGREIGDTALNTWGRTVGYFTTLVPIFAAIGPGTPVEEAVAAVKDAYRAVLRDGSNGFASCMFGQDPLTASDIEVLFNFKGEREIATGITVEEPQLLGLLKILAEYRERQLHFKISYSSDIAHQNRLLAWITELERSLKDFASRLPYKKPRLTISEMPLLGVRDEEVESIQRHFQLIGIEHSNVESVLPCAPVQEGILFAQLKSQRRQYWECLTLKIKPEGTNQRVDVDKVAAAWKTLCVAQPMLRTIFTSSPTSVGAFQQVILKETEPSISYGKVEMETELKEVLRTMEDLHFAAAQPPHHLHITRASNSVVYASFLMNHVLFDDRSFRLISQQLRQAYGNLGSIRKGLDISRYISWIRDHPDPAKDYWKDHLAGSQPCLIAVLNPFESNLLDKSSPPHIDVSINEPSLLQACCRQHGVTIANIVQVAWGLVLRQCNGSPSVTFGCGQSQIGAVEGDETTLGPLLANMICRIDVGPGTTLLRLLKKVRDDSLRALELPSYSMGELHEAIGLGQLSLFDTAMSLVRFPPENPTNADGISVESLAPDENLSEVGPFIHPKCIFMR